jgi:Glycogen debranching enzyme N terminal
MITIRSSKTGSTATLMCVEIILKTARNVYTISSDRALADSGSSFDQGLFGGISWPVSRFRIEEGLLLEQQMFLPRDESTVAMSWALHGDTAKAAQLVVRPFFSGCGPRFYRNVGFQFDSEDNGERLTWLPNVRGPRLFADTNGRYHDETVRSLDCFCDEEASSGSAEDLITPGRFEFGLSRRPAVLILSAEDRATTPHHQHVGVFLAGLMQENTSALANSAARESTGVKIQQPAIA